MKRLYETDSYIKVLETVVTEAGDDEKGRPYICLADTIFFPEEGGQNADTGYLVLKGQSDACADTDPPHKIRVLDGIITGRNTCSSVSEGSGIQIRYIVSEPVAAGTGVICYLDWGKRYDRMQNHSGEHILTGVIHNRYGFDNVGFHLSDTGFVTLDLNGVLTYEQVIEAEKEANRVVYANMPIKDSYPTAQELEGITYRSKIDIDGQVRLITIGSDDETVDVCACCAPHVARTGEIGLIKVISVINWKGGIQIAMLCGRRALEYINKEHDILTETAVMLSTEAVNVPDIVNKHREEITELKARLAQALENGVKYRIGSGEADETGCIFVEGDFPAGSMKNIYNSLAGLYTDRYVGLFAGDDGTGYRYYAGSRNRDSRKLAVTLKEALNAKGGGSAEMIQGKVQASRKEIEDYFRSM